MPVQVRHIQFVIAAADYGSFRRAALALGVQESAISRRIRELEERLGTTIFVRSSCGVRLTHAGMQFVQRGRKALAEICLAKTEVGAIGRGEYGNVRIGIFSSLASGFLSDLILSFGERYGTVKLTFTDGNPAEHAVAIRRRRLDVAFVTGTAKWEGCDSLHLWSERVYAVLPSSHQFANASQITFKDIEGESFIVSESAPGQEIHDYLVKRLADLGRHPEIDQQAVGRDNLMHLVALGRGLTITSEATTAAQFPGVVFRPIVGETLPFSAVWLRENDNPAFRNLLALAHSIASPKETPEIRSGSAPRLRSAASSQIRDLSR